MSARISPHARFFRPPPSPACGRKAAEEGAFALPTLDSKRFRAPVGARVPFSLLAQRERNQRETAPRWRALRAFPDQVRDRLCPAGARAGYGVVRRDSCPGEKLARIPASHPTDFPIPARRAIAAPGKAARSQRAEAKAKAKAEALRACSAPAFACASGAHDAHLLFRGPWAAVRRGRKGRAAGEARDGLAFSRGQEPARKARPRLTDLPGRRPGKRQPGWPSLLLRASCPPPFGPASPFTRVPDARVVTFLLATQEKSNPGAAGARNRSEVCVHAKARALLTPTLPPDGEAVGGVGVERTGARP